LLFTSSFSPVPIPAIRNDNPVDICGAGDAFEAGLALALAATMRLAGQSDYTAAAEIGHRVAAVTIMKKGTGTASRAEVSSSKFQVPS
jgi:sugar/nucleoside kinase (ribokinase family)